MLTNSSLNLRPYSPSSLTTPRHFIGVHWQCLPILILTYLGANVPWVRSITLLCLVCGHQKWLGCYPNWPGYFDRYFWTSFVKTDQFYLNLCNVALFTNVHFYGYVPRDHKQHAFVHTHSLFYVSLRCGHGFIICILHASRRSMHSRPSWLPCRHLAQ